MKLQKLKYDFSICKVAELEEADLTREFCFVSRTDDEISVVCRTKYAPANQIPVFVVSTYNTDYVFVKKDVFEEAITLLDENGYTIS
ncbi:MAG: ACT domain-containing protein [Lachnospiraceae bacterium]|nr:ACT domain-containing protein [Lachnospiraceae bacterium]